MLNTIPLENAPESGPHERVQSGFSRDHGRVDQLAVALTGVPAEVMEAAVGTWPAGGFVWEASRLKPDGAR